jgi:Fur family peroxide stress response transcriptional regulator
MRVAPKNNKPEQTLNRRLATGGFRFTPQREHVYSLLTAKRDHPTAEQVFFRAKAGMPGISMATVYNCLDALVQCGLVRQVALERGPARFCPNMSEHSHFYCDFCEGVFDIGIAPHTRFRVPNGFKAERYEIAIHGRCPTCSKRRK